MRTSTTDLLNKIIRTEPSQERSANRVTLLLDSAAAIIAERGIEGLTTTEVATRAGSSVGVVYRYFPNIRSLLQALATRNLHVYLERLQSLLPTDTTKWRNGLDCTIDLYVEMMRTEPGFRAIRFGDLLEERLLAPDDTNGGMLGQLFVQMLHDLYGFKRTPESLFSLELAVETSEALLRRAFQTQPDGDERFIAAARRIAQAEIDAMEPTL
ncbi:MAG: transcriptional regulator, TetR family protein [Homoserinimonas sp.]|jgi:AcrR family transcriptional regulator|nr:transcriptional regulator, TetR family protein [Homoserinimonas sp.]